eukprot:TRINITY_DN58721_c0_g1_i1.p1 TRINITY_DN58721_c0_g1~~TRINITY_DN58721_c0_g1_i1.p1  ORF type:complete len:205 (+),score=57.89 TRINITY_DN58721_c0_g1_i1:44-616(+)
MGKKGKQDAPPEPVEDPPEDEEREAAPPLPPEAASAILKALDWEVFVMPATRRRYFYSKTRREARVQPPYHSVLGLEESRFRSLTKDEMWKAFFAQRERYKRHEANGALSEELQRPEDQVDWNLIMEAFNVLSDQAARAEYEERNLAPHARLQLVGLRVMHEAEVREQEAAAAKAAAAAAALPEGTEQTA